MFNCPTHYKVTGKDSPACKVMGYGMDNQDSTPVQQWAMEWIIGIQLLAGQLSLHSDGLWEG
jgi:hypothetical protein